MSDDNTERSVGDGDIDGLSTKMEAFADGLDPTERALFEALLEQAGPTEEAEVAGFSQMGFKAASMLAMDPLRGGFVQMGRNATTSTSWGRWNRSGGSDGWSRNIDHIP